MLNLDLQQFLLASSAKHCESGQMVIPLIHRPSKILNHLSKTMHSAASLRKKGKTLSLPLHAHSKHMGRRKILLGQGIFKKCPIQAKNHFSFSK